MTCSREDTETVWSAWGRVSVSQSTSQTSPPLLDKTRKDKMVPGSWVKVIGVPGGDPRVDPRHAS